MKGNNKYGYNPKKGRQQIQAQETLSAHDRKLVHDVFLISVEWLEKYIEIAYKNEFPNWENRKQVRDNLTITRTDIYQNPQKLEESLSTGLLLLESSAGEEPFRNELKQEFNKWISAVGINADNCPERLKHYLFGVNEILEGRGGKILRDAANRKRDIEINSPEYMEHMSRLFSNTHPSMQKEREVGKSLKGKTHTEINIESKFGSGSSKQGEQTLNQISNAVASRHDDFHFYPQTQQLTSIHPTNLNEVVQEVKTNPQNWTFDEITTEINRLGWAKKQEPAVYCQHARLDEYNQEGKLNFDNNPIYLWENFNSQQRFEIKQAKNLSGDYLTNEEINWVVREVKKNPRVWRIGEIDKQIYLIHNSAQIKNNEIGTLIHSQQKFNEAKWAEINGAFERAKLIDNIKQNTRLERSIVVFEPKSGKYYEADDYFIHNEWKNTNEAGCLIFNSDAMVRAKDLSEAEQREVNYKSETFQQVQTNQNNRPQGGGSGFGGTVTWGFVSVISLIGLAFTR